MCNICRALKREMFALETELITILGSDGEVRRDDVWAHIETLKRDLITAQRLFVEHVQRCPGGPRPGAAALVTFRAARGLPSQVRFPKIAEPDD